MSDPSLACQLTGEGDDRRPLSVAKLCSLHLDPRVAFLRLSADFMTYVLSFPVTIGPDVENLCITSLLLDILGYAPFVLLFVQPAISFAPDQSHICHSLNCRGIEEHARGARIPRSIHGIEVKTGEVT